VKPGERIRLIKETATTLSKRPWAEIQLTLREFDISTWEPFEPDEFAYCTRQLQEATDEVLSEVHEFLLGEDAAPMQVEPDAIWGNQPARVFLSHTHHHREFLGEVKACLAGLGVSGFVAHSDINPSAQWRGTIRAALMSCHMLAAFLSDEFHDSQWCDQEVGWALGRGVPVLPVRFAEVSERKDGFIEEAQEIALGVASVYRRANRASEAIFDCLFTHASTRDVAVQALAEAFVHSESYDRTR
jgi:hypothetical protein